MNHHFLFKNLIYPAIPLLLSLTAIGQETPSKSERLTTENGLSSNVVYSIIQDSKGYLWIGTNDGLNRYDGYGFKIYRQIFGDTSSLTANTVYSICEDSEGSIWVATQEGVCRFNEEKNNFTRIIGVKNEAPAVTQQIIKLNKDELMIVSHPRIWIINIHTKDVRNAEIGNNRVQYRFGGPVLNPLNQDKKGNIYLVACDQDSDRTINHIFIYEPQKKSFIEFSTFGLLTDIGNRETLSYFCLESDGSSWLGTANPGRLIHYKPGTGSNMSLNVPALTTGREIINHVFEAREGNIWIATAKGVFLHERSTGKLSTYNYHSSVENKTIVATTIMQDRTGVIWTGSLNGLYKIIPSQGNFRNLTANVGTNPLLLNNFVLGIRSVSPNKTMIEYYWGISKFSMLDLSGQTIEHYSLRDYDFTEYLKNLFLKNSGQFHEDSFKEQLPIIRDFRNSLEKHSPSLFFDRQKNIWLFTQMDLRRLDRKETMVFSDVEDAQILGDYIWIARRGRGLGSVHTTTGKLIEYLHNPEQKNSISSNGLICLLVESNGNIWIGSKGQGLDYFDRKKNIFTNYTMAEGLCNNSIFSMVMDDKGRLWLGTGNGLSSFDTTAKTFTNFFRKDGLVNLEFNRHSACKLPDGSILMGGMDGIDYFHPDKVISSVIRSQTQITGFNVYHKAMPITSDITLAHDKNYITIDFAGMDFRNPAGNQFAYKLVGFDKDWVNAGALPSVSYATLSPGRYHFLVKSAGRDGIWNEQAAEIKFTILAPWWKASWFLILAVCFILIVLYSIYRFRIQQLKKLIVVRAKISRDLHDEVGATLTSISLLSAVAKKQVVNEDSPASLTIDKIGEYSREMIDEMNDIVWAINPANDKLRKMEDRMNNFATTLLATKNIQLNFQSDEQVKLLVLGMQQRKNLYLIFKEALNNAAKYAGCSEVSVNVFKEGQQIRLDVSDNGKGFLQDDSSNGNGLKNMQSRAKEVNGSLHINSKPGRGTTISLSIPITPIAYK